MVSSRYPRCLSYTFSVITPALIVILHGWANATVNIVIVFNTRYTYLGENTITEGSIHTYYSSPPSPLIHALTGVDTYGMKKRVWWKTGELKKNCIRQWLVWGFDRDDKQKKQIVFTFYRNIKQFVACNGEDMILEQNKVSLPIHLCWQRTGHWKLDLGWGRIIIN